MAGYWTRPRSWRRLFLGWQRRSTPQRAVYVHYQVQLGASVMTRYEVRPGKSPTPRKLSPQPPPQYPTPPLSGHRSSSERRCRSQEVLPLHKTLLQTLRGIVAARRKPLQQNPAENLHAELTSPSLMLRGGMVEWWSLVLLCLSDKESECTRRDTHDALTVQARAPGERVQLTSHASPAIREEALLFARLHFGCCLRHFCYLHPAVFPCTSFELICCPCCIAFQGELQYVGRD